MKNISLAGQYYGEVFGGTISAPVWHDIMEQASQGMAVRQFDPPSSKIASGDMVAIPYVSGMSVAQATAALTAAGFSAQVTGQTNSSLPQGTVVFTTPSGTAVRGSSVGLVLSTGYVPPPPAPAPAPKPKPSPSTSTSTPTPSPKPTKPKH
jgi:beta-lactam-binding protein with PASTA domain